MFSDLVDSVSIHLPPLAPACHWLDFMPLVFLFKLWERHFFKPTVGSASGHLADALTAI